jgi:hypothetical protein
VVPTAVLEVTANAEYRVDLPVATQSTESLWLLCFTLRTRFMALLSNMNVNLELGGGDPD